MGDKLKFYECCQAIYNILSDYSVSDAANRGNYYRLLTFVEDKVNKLAWEWAWAESTLKAYDEKYGKEG